MARAIVVALVLAMACATAVVSAGRVRVMPPGFMAVFKEPRTNQAACHGAADMALRVLHWGSHFGSDFSMSDEIKSMKRFDNLAWNDPGKTLCNGKDRVLYLGVGVSPKDKPVTDHYFVLQTYGGKGEYAMMYQSYSGSEHKDNQGKSYKLWEYVRALEPYLSNTEKTKEQDKATFEAQQNAYKGFPPILKQLPCDCADMAKLLQKALDSDNSFTIQGVYNDMFAPPNDKISANAGFTAFGRVWQEKDFFQLYKYYDTTVYEGFMPKAKGAFLEQAMVHAMAQRVKTPLAMMHVKHAKAKYAKVLAAADQ